jgi:hypothetical protein
MENARRGSEIPDYPIYLTNLRIRRLARINNGTQELAGQELLNYQKKRWPA